MLLFVGLGNPGSRHVGNRHNIGFMAVEAIAKRHNIGPFRRRFQGVVAEGLVGTERVLLLLPGTFMNESGRAVAEAANFYKLDLAHITVFHDEIDLAEGKVRVKVGGGVAGHNGLRSITAQVGNDYRRVRIGVGRPAHKDQVQSYVLNDFANDQRPWVEALCELIADNAALLAKGMDASFQNKIHLGLDARGFFKADELEEPRPPAQKAPKEDPRET